MTHMMRRGPPHLKRAEFNKREGPSTVRENTEVLYFGLSQGKGTKSLMG